MFTTATIRIPQNFGERSGDRLVSIRLRVFLFGGVIVRRTDQFSMVNLIVLGVDK